MWIYWHQLHNILSLVLSPWSVAFLIAIVVFRTPLSTLSKSFHDLIQRFSHGKINLPGGVSLEGNVIQQTKPDSPSFDPKKTVGDDSNPKIKFEYHKSTELMWPSSIEYVHGLTNAITAAQTIHPNYTISNVIDFAATIRAELDFERFYRNSFGSQLKLLLMLNPAGDAGIDSAQTIDAYVVSRNQWPTNLQSYSYDNWIGYLKQFNMISEIPLDQSRRIAISIRGRDFLIYAAKSGLTYDKAY